jgi:hypothetical protein
LALAGLVRSNPLRHASGMALKQGIKGKSVRVRAPEWEPLLNVAGRHVDEFMWMFGVELADGTRLQAYKNYWTRHYLHLDAEGRAFVYVEPNRYEEIDLDWALSRVLREDVLNSERFGDLWGKRFDPGRIELHWVPAATSLGISRERAEHVVRSCGLRFSHRTRVGASKPYDWPVLFIGEDAEGLAIEVTAIGVCEEAFLVFHASELRDEYRGLLARASEWRA